MIHAGGHRRVGALPAEALARLRRAGDPCSSGPGDGLPRGLAVAASRSRGRARGLGVGASRAADAEPALGTRACGASRAARWSRRRWPGARDRRAEVGRRRAGWPRAGDRGSRSSRSVARRARLARAKRSQARAKERKSVRPPQRWAASIGQTPPLAVDVGADDDVVGADALEHRHAGATRQAVDRQAQVFDRRRACVA